MYVSFTVMLPPTIMNHKPFKVVANLPLYYNTYYYVCWKVKLPIERLVVMVQKRWPTDDSKARWYKGTMAHYLLLFSIIRNQILFLMYRLNLLLSSDKVHPLRIGDKPPVDAIDGNYFSRCESWFAQRRKKHSLIR